MVDSKKRIESIDILRGFDLFWLLFLQPVIISIPGKYNEGWLHNIMFQLDHEKWVGFRCWDLVMPLFLFLVGASMPFSFSKYKNKNSSGPVYIKIMRRVLILFILGMVVQGNLLAFSFDTLEIYNNTLQAIAAGYLIAAIILLNCNIRLQIIFTFFLLIIYSIPMAIYGEYEPDNSFAFMVDQFVIGRFHGDLTYTWVWSSLTFGATVMFGALSGEVIKRYRNTRGIKIITILGVCGCSLIVLGLLAGIYEPIIKRIWTSSMTMFSAGICMMLLCFFYWWIDVLHLGRGLRWLKIYGTNAITAYCLGEVINFRSVVNSLTYGLQPYIPDWYGFVLTLGNALVLFLILWLLYKSRIMIKI